MQVADAPPDAKKQPVQRFGTESGAPSSEVVDESIGDAFVGFDSPQMEAFLSICLSKQRPHFAVEV